ncbi:MAG: class I SAM-dependent methyltransferase [Desulfobulbaceae bacterium]|nr:class I SAM-dependent methyltransferase [Desulfobulbaceae bacterium]
MHNQGGDKKQVKEFWTRNVCQADLPKAEKGSKEFFDEVEGIRYRYHYHLMPLFDRIAAEYNADCQLLEIGCGMGSDLLQLARRGLKVTGVDLTDAGIELARKRFSIYGKEGDLRVADAENLPFEDMSFDVVYSFGVLHHTPDTPKSIREVHRVLRPGGKAFIMLYYRPSLNYLAHYLTGVPFDGSKGDKCPVERAYTKREIREMFAPFKNVDIKIDYLFGTGWGKINAFTPKFLHRALGRIIGWHAMIEASK